MTRPAAEIAEVLGRVGERFADPGDRIREAALRDLPGEAALSPELAEAVVDGMVVDWTRQRIAGLLFAEFGDAGVLDGIVETGVCRGWRSDRASRLSPVV